ncbi:UNVERIFIED_CONTAM: hypothetical protein GTU68_005710 [Idotea baltica]|nr:hypothetical protein [Idotea baltica]
MAFKDFGARVMARVLGDIETKTGKTAANKRTVLVATSGDTGGAVAAGFHGVKNVRVIILYPENKVSPLQRAQMHSFAIGENSNVEAIAVRGTFDDCQKLVKLAFSSKELSEQFGLTSANSINLARLLPQTCYYVNAVKQFYERGDSKTKAPVFCVPSGNFGNCTAGLISQRRGLAISSFIVATNRNKVFVDFLKSGQLEAMPSVQTISNAMDVGNPSNFERIRELFANEALNSAANQLNDSIKGYWFDDQATKDEIARTYNKQGYILDPHTAVGVLASKAWRQGNKRTSVITLATAHPGKFSDVVSDVLPQIESKIDLSTHYPRLIDTCGAAPFEPTLKSLEHTLRGTT